MRPVFGVDLSNNNGDINAATVSQNVDFVFHKATEGLTFTDRYYALRGSALMGLGVPFGAYHYARVHESAAAQVGHFLNVAKLRPPMLVPFVDIEGSGNEGATGQQWRDWLAEWFHEIINVHNRRCGVYVSPGFADTYHFGAMNWLGALADANESYLFVAHWGVNHPRVPQPWSRANIWQYTDAANVPGVAGKCDGDRWLDTWEPWTVKR